MESQKSKTINYYRSKRTRTPEDIKKQFETFYKANEEFEAIRTYGEFSSTMNGVLVSPVFYRIIEDCLKGKIKTIVVNDILKISTDMGEIGGFLSILKQIGVEVYSAKDNREMTRIIDEKQKEFKNILSEGVKM